MAQRVPRTIQAPVGYATALLFLFAYILLILLILFHGGHQSVVCNVSDIEQGVIDDVRCQDCNPCTYNVYYANTDSCQFPAKEQASSCSVEDVCYAPGAVKYCSCGQCMATREFCRGACSVASDCPTLNTTVSPAQLLTLCQMGSCYYYLTGLTSQMCAQWLTDYLLVAQGCLQMEQDFNQLSVDDPEVNNLCSYKFACAPIVYEDLTTASKKR